MQRQFVDCKDQADSKHNNNDNNGISPGLFAMGKPSLLPNAQTPLVSTPQAAEEILYTVTEEAQQQSANQTVMPAQSTESNSDQEEYRVYTAAHAPKPVGEHKLKPLPIATDLLAMRIEEIFPAFAVADLKQVDLSVIESTVQGIKKSYSEPKENPLESPRTRGMRLAVNQLNAEYIGIILDILLNLFRPTAKVEKKAAGQPSSQQPTLDLFEISDFQIFHEILKRNRDFHVAMKEMVQHFFISYLDRTYFGNNLRAIAKFNKLRRSGDVDQILPWILNFLKDDKIFVVLNHIKATIFACMIDSHDAQAVMRNYDLTQTQNRVCMNALVMDCGVREQRWRISRLLMRALHRNPNQAAQNLRIFFDNLDLDLQWAVLYLPTWDQDTRVGAYVPAEKANREIQGKVIMYTFNVIAHEAGDIQSRKDLIAFLMEFARDKELAHVKYCKELFFSHAAEWLNSFVNHLKEKNETEKLVRFLDFIKANAGDDFLCELLKTKLGNDQTIIEVLCQGMLTGTTKSKNHQASINTLRALLNALGPLRKGVLNNIYQHYHEGIRKAAFDIINDCCPDQADEKLAQREKQLVLTSSSNMFSPSSPKASQHEPKVILSNPGPVARHKSRIPHDPNKVRVAGLVAGKQ